MSTARRYDELAEVIAARLALNQRVRRNLPGGGRVRIDRQLPFLCVYRQPTARLDPGTRELVTTEAAYLFESGEPQNHAGLADLCRRIASTLAEHFGTFLFIEVWSQDVPAGELAEDDVSLIDLDDDTAHRPAFQVVTQEADTLPSVVEQFAASLGEIQSRRVSAEVEVVTRETLAPPDLPPLFDVCGEHPACVALGLAVRPIYRDRQTDRLYPVVLQRLRQQLAPAIRKTVAVFTGVGSEKALPHYQAYGPTALVRAVRTVDEQLSEVAEAFDFIYQATPVNAESAWRQFAAHDYDVPPTFWYRPLPYDPNYLKRKLFEVPIERIEDTTVSYLFAEKQVELDRQLTALRDIDSPQFLYGSLQLYGRPGAQLLKLAEQILKAHAPGAHASRAHRPDHRVVHAADVVTAAREEMAAYQRIFPAFQGLVEVCDDIAAGIMVVDDRLLVARSVEIPKVRLKPLLHHEIGIHLLTYFNGQAQPFGQLRVGLAGYEPLQEGLAVLSEHLSGGLTTARLRRIAARVVAVHCLCEGADFLETFRTLHTGWGLSARGAFRTTLRVYRGGGLTKDLVYLKGLRDLLEYLQQDHDLEPLFVGKIALAHVPFIQELRRRDLIHPPAVLPRLLEDEAARAALAELRGGSIESLCGVNP